MVITTLTFCLFDFTSEFMFKARGKMRGWGILEMGLIRGSRWEHRRPSNRKDKVSFPQMTQREVSMCHDLIGFYAETTPNHIFQYHFLITFKIKLNIIFQNSRELSGACWYKSCKFATFWWTWLRRPMKTQHSKSTLGPVDLEETLLSISRITTNGKEERARNCYKTDPLIMRTAFS